jgi:hypothetical protein
MGLAEEIQATAMAKLKITQEAEPEPGDISINVGEGFTVKFTVRNTDDQAIFRYVALSVRGTADATLVGQPSQLLHVAHSLGPGESRKLSVGFVAQKAHDRRRVDDLEKQHVQVVVEPIADVILLADLDVNELLSRIWFWKSYTAKVDIHPKPEPSRIDA